MRCTWGEFSASAKLGSAGEVCGYEAVDSRHKLCGHHLDQAVRFAREATGLNHKSLDGSKSHIKRYVGVFLAGVGTASGKDAWEALKAHILGIIEMLSQPMGMHPAALRMPQNLPLRAFREMVEKLAPEGMDPALVDQLTTIEFRDATVELVNELLARARVVRASDLR